MRQYHECGSTFIMFICIRVSYSYQMSPALCMLHCSTSHVEERANDAGHTEMHNDTAAAASQRRADDANGEMTAGHVATGNGGRPKRATHHGEYDEVSRRKRRRTQVSAYMDRGGRRTASGAVKRGAIAIGAAAMEWITQGQYEWRDQRFTQVRGKRRKFWST